MAGAFPFLLAPRAFAAAGDRPNLIFVLTDDQRADSLGCYGNQEIQTPHIDRLAREGVLFENASVTSAICTPSRACYFLGQYERFHGVNFNSGTALAPEAWDQSYPVLLRKAGYFTGYIGKNHVPIGAEGYATGIIEKSFDFWYGAHNHLTFYPKTRHPIFKQAKADTQPEILAEGAASFLNSNAEFIAGAEAFLRKRPTDRPFCLSICFNLPHRAGTGSMRQLPSDPELYRTRYRDRMHQFRLPAHYTPKDQIRTPKLPANVLYAEYRQNSYEYVDTEAALREHMVRVYQTVTGIDNVVGAIRDQLRSLGLDRNTVILFSSDHGIMEGEYGLGGKGLNYEPCLHVPLIIYDPRLPKETQGRRLPQLVQSIDVAPTLLELAGLRAPSTMQGASMVPLLRRRPAAWRECAFAENLWSTYYGNPRVESARDARWKYIRYFATDRGLFTRAKQQGFGPYQVSPEQAKAYREWLSASARGLRPDYEELFDLLEDPHESRNLVSSPKHASTLERMRRECDRLVREAKRDLDADPRTIPLPPKLTGGTAD
ncbi:MAG: sulfatase-like hydrolase/transferase [Nitrospira sp.]|nr:sulfatase-like hydrolase/transferase [Nitrospira sp.]